MKESKDLRYPIGEFEYGKNYSIEDTRKHIKTIARLPKELKKALKKLKDGALDKVYRPGGWTARQVIHHLADSHMHSYIRCKRAITETAPIVNPYEEKLWAETEDAKHGSAKYSIRLLTALHGRWIEFLRSLSDDDLERSFFHSGTKRTLTIREVIALYAWHSKHHLAHINIVADGKGLAVEKTKKSTPQKEKVKASKKEASKTASADKTPKKRSLSPEHKAKITAAQRARRAAEKAAKPSPAATQKDATPKKPGPKPKTKPTPEQAKRPRRSSAEVAAEKAAKAAMPKIPRTEIMAKARADKAIASPKKAIPGKPKRARRSSAEVAAEKAAKAAMPKIPRAEILAKARGTAAANRAAAGKPAKPKKDPNTPKLSREESLAKARAARIKRQK